MSLQAEIERCFTHPQGASGVIFENETARGRTALRPGDVTWFLTADWTSGSVASVKDGVARLVLLDAIRPGAGAFGRLIDAIRAAELRPVVVEPTREFAAVLSRRGWKRRSHRFGIEHEEVWRSPQTRGAPREKDR